MNFAQDSQHSPMLRPWAETRSMCDCITSVSCVTSVDAVSVCLCGLMLDLQFFELGLCMHLFDIALPNCPMRASQCFPHDSSGNQGSDWCLLELSACVSHPRRPACILFGKYAPRGVHGGNMMHDARPHCCKVSDYLESC